MCIGWDCSEEISCCYLICFFGGNGQLCLVCTQSKNGLQRNLLDASQVCCSNTSHNSLVAMSLFPAIDELTPDEVGDVFSSHSRFIHDFWQWFEPLKSNRMSLNSQSLQRLQHRRPRPSSPKEKRKRRQTWAPRRRKQRSSHPPRHPSRRSQWNDHQLLLRHLSSAQPQWWNQLLLSLLMMQKLLTRRWRNDHLHLECLQVFVPRCFLLADVLRSSDPPSSMPHTYQATSKWPACTTTKRPGNVLSNWMVLKLSRRVDSGLIFFLRRYFP